MFLCSYERQQTRAQASSLFSHWTDQIFVADRCGEQGKCAALYERGIGTLFDDSPDVVEECQWWGIRTFAIVLAFLERHWRHRETFRTFASAVDAFLEEERKKVATLTKGCFFHGGLDKRLP